MKFEDWQLGQFYDVLTSADPYPLGQLIQKYQVDQIIALDFKKESGEEYLYITDESETYVIHRGFGEVQGTTNREPPSTSADRG